MKIVQVAGNETPFRFVGNKSKVNVIYHYYKIHIFMICSPKGLAKQKWLFSMA